MSITVCHLAVYLISMGASNIPSKCLISNNINIRLQYLYNCMVNGYRFMEE